MPDVIEQVGQHYPDSAEHLRKLPPHIAEQVGEVALRLTHVDMHPAETVKGDYGKEWQKIDFEHVITDPDYDISQLEAQAVEAAKAGKEKVAAVLRTSTGSLKTAHESLAEGGFVFGNDKPETDEARQVRETHERDAVYSEALHQTIDAAIKAKAAGNIEETTALMESLTLLTHLNPAEHRLVFRQAVRDGLADELLAGGQEANKLFLGEALFGPGHELNSAKRLLEYATGTKLDYGLKEQGEFDINNTDRQISFEDLQDALAVATMPNAPFTLQQVFELASSLTCVATIKERAATASPEDMARILLSVTEITDPRDMMDAFKYEDPGAAYQAAKQLDLAVWEVETLFGVAQEDSPLLGLNQEQVEDMVALQQTFPDYFPALKHELWRRRPSGQYDAKEILSGLQTLQASGLDNPIFFEGLCNYPDVPKYVETCQAVVKELANFGSDITQLEASLSKYSPRYDSMYRLIENLAEPETNITGWIERLLTSGQIVDAYKGLYDNLEYPIVRRSQAEKTVELSKLPLLEERLQRLGLSAEVAEAIFTSWSTFDAFAQTFQNGPPRKAPEEATLASTAREQATALITQMEALEVYASMYGNEAMDQIISTFGIYNFGRHKPGRLHDQMERWQRGEPVRSAVVDARYDWNSYTGNVAVFAEEEGHGVFHFEANSGTDAARIAVLIGKRERELGREPAVRRFILHAHGNADGMVMGVNRELIDVSGYRKASRDRSKISGAEINDYKRHLGPNFEVILQSCSTGGDNFGDNVAETISQQHDAGVTASRININGLKILSDGSVEFTSTGASSAPVTYRP